MALAYLTEGSTTLAAAAWSDATGFASGATLVIDSLGSQNIVTAVDQSAVVAIAYLSVSANFSGNIGSAASPLKFEATTGFYNDASGGVIYWASAGADADPDATTLLSHTGAGTTNCVGGTVTQVQQSMGFVNAGQSTIVTTVRQSGGSSFYDYNATAITNLYLMGGTCYVKRGVTNYYIYGGRFIYEVIANVTTGFIGPNGNVDHRGGDIATLEVGGSFTVYNLRRAATIGGTALTTWAGASMQRTTRGSVVATFSNETKIAGGPSTSPSASGNT